MSIIPKYMHAIMGLSALPFLVQAAIRSRKGGFVRSAAMSSQFPRDILIGAKDNVDHTGAKLHPPFIGVVGDQEESEVRCTIFVPNHGQPMVVRSVRLIFGGESPVNVCMALRERGETTAYFPIGVWKDGVALGVPFDRDEWTFCFRAIVADTELPAFSFCAIATIVELPPPSPPAHVPFMERLGNFLRWFSTSDGNPQGRPGR